MDDVLAARQMQFHRQRQLCDVHAAASSECVGASCSSVAARDHISDSLQKLQWLDANT